mmetsp:Transcript_9935/g.17901  ORF Transcript_9935/g.17901 Transcript_9935/m.17901 type:complete len:93 (+) Transcript_9935:495-773(+)
MEQLPSDFEANKIEYSMINIGYEVEQRTLQNIMGPKGFTVCAEKMSFTVKRVSIDERSRKKLVTDKPIPEKNQMGESQRGFYSWIGNIFETM